MSTRTRTALLDAAAVNGWEVRDGDHGGNLFFLKGTLGIFVGFTGQGTRIGWAEASEESEDAWIAPRIFTERGRASHIASDNVLAQVLRAMSA